MFYRSDVDDSPFFIAEVGQNHQGEVDLALQYIKEFSAAGASAIKFQTRNNKFLFSECAYSKSYDSENAFADTYGLHRESLELPVDCLSDLREECHKAGTLFISTPFDEPSLDVLVDVGVDALKIASFDLGNIPFIKKIAATKIPLIMSVGGGKAHHILPSVEAILEHHNDLAILHCVSEYPCAHDRMGLDNIDVLRSYYPDLSVGLSDHFKGIVSGPVAYMKGARVFEKHVTLDRTWKGTDHSFALLRHGFRNFVRDIKRVPEMMPAKPDSELGEEFVFKKLGKSIVSRSDMKAGDLLTLEGMSGRIFQNQYIPVRESGALVGKVVNKNIKAGQAIQWDDFE